MKKLFTIAILIFTVITLTGCKSDYEKLNDDERQVVDRVINTITEFNHPGSVRVTGNMSISVSENGDLNWALTPSIELSETNGFGETSVMCYSITRYTIEDNEEAGSCSTYASDLGIDINKVNDALKEHYSEQGWN